MSKQLFATILIGLGVAFSGTAYLNAAEAISPRTIINEYCVRCHNNQLKTGNLVLEDIETEDMVKNAEVWEKIVKKLHTGSMPPMGVPRPDESTYKGFIEAIELNLDQGFAKNPNPGRTLIHRLNRVEYANVIRDLLDLSIDGTALLPADNQGYGFDNIADVLTVSPGLLERYLLAAKKISRLAVGDHTIRPEITTYNVPYMTLVQDDRISDDLPFGSRGGISVQHYFPVDGKYEINIRMQRHSLNIGNEIRGLDVVNKIDLRLDGERLKVFMLGGDREYDADPYTEQEDIADHILNFEFQAKAGMHRVGVAFDRDMWYVEGVGMATLPPASDGYASGVKTEQNYGRINMGVDHIEVIGPFNGTVPQNSASRERIFICEPQNASEETPCAQTILSTLANRAYRRPATETEIQALMSFYADGREERDFNTGIQQSLVRLLMDPDFLFRIERDPTNIQPGQPYLVSDLELASRLSFFLWSSIPDIQLLEIATQGKLKEPAIFESEVRRMLADKRSNALLRNFFGQWLLVRNMGAHRPDPLSFPEFDENLRQAFQSETELFLQSQLKEDRHVTEILNADYTFVNERLARHYGIPNIYGNHFRKVMLPNNQRAGLLGQGSVLAVTSYADRTSVVLRGKWVMENLLGVPPPPPPANVPPLENVQVKGSLRQRMEMHRKNPVCAACHRQLDPMGFAFENFDGIGKWRETDGGTAVDASGALLDGSTFTSPATFREALVHKSDAFMGSLTEKLLTYALGRGVEYYDMPAVRQIIRNTQSAGNQWSTLILNIVKSMPFQMRRVES